MIKYHGTDLIRFEQYYYQEEYAYDKAVQQYDWYLKPQAIQSG